MPTSWKGATRAEAAPRDDEISAMTSVLGMRRRRAPAEPRAAASVSVPAFSWGHYRRISSVLRLLSRQAEGPGPWR